MPSLPAVCARRRRIFSSAAFAAFASLPAFTVLALALVRPVEVAFRIRVPVASLSEVVFFSAVGTALGLALSRAAGLEPRVRRLCVRHVVIVIHRGLLERGQKSFKLGLSRKVGHGEVGKRRLHLADALELLFHQLESHRVIDGVGPALLSVQAELADVLGQAVHNRAAQLHDACRRL